MSIRLIPGTEDIETSNNEWWFRPVVILKLSHKKELYYHCGRDKIFNSQGVAFERAKRFISLYHKFAEAGPPKRAPFYICDCMSPGCPCKGNCNNIATREVEYPDKHQQCFWLCENCLHEFFCGFPELKEEYGHD